MDEQQLAEIDQRLDRDCAGHEGADGSVSYCSCFATDASDLIAEVRRLRKGLQEIADGLHDLAVPITSGAENAWRKGYAQWLLDARKDD